MVDVYNTMVYVFIDDILIQIWLCVLVSSHYNVM